MKTITLIFLLITTSITLAQHTAIPDQNFEQALIDLGLDDVIDGQVLTANIENVTELYLSEMEIQDMTGIQDFSSLIELWLDDNLITSLDVSQNSSLQFLVIDLNPISSIDISNNSNLVGFAADFTNLTGLDTSNNPNLMFLYLWDCNITSLDLSNNPSLLELDVDENNLTQLDLSNNPNLEIVYCGDNFNLSFINLKNGNTAGLEYLYAFDIANNACIQVDDAAAATAGTTFPYNLWDVDPTAIFSEDCSLSTSDFTGLQIQVYPNPTSGLLNVNTSEVLTYSIYGIDGSLIKKSQTLLNNTISLENLKTGVYFVQFQSENKGMETIKIIKK
jgi:hypothetical protein